MMPRHGFRVLGLSVPLLLAGLGAWAIGDRPAPPPFDHAEHGALFPASCATCHLGASQPDAPLWPQPTRCAACHDGEVASQIDWTPPTGSRPTNLRFTHATHLEASGGEVGCTDCHAGGDPKGPVVRRAVGQCIDCHVGSGQHLTVPDAECATCHLPLAEATRLTLTDVAGFPVPPSHAVAGFSLGGHGEGASMRGPDGQLTVASSCATCHAQNFCINCHVNAPEVPAIRALASDQRSLVHRANFMAPPSHEALNFIAAHGREARRNEATCAACHTQPSCTGCHVATPPAPVTAMYPPGPGRAVGAQVTRHPPPSHTVAFREGHGSEAAAAPRTCSTCHMREDCLSCHRPNTAEPSGGSDYHPTGFLARHPSAAYARQTSCGDCHNAQQFCVSCHAQAGLNARNTQGGANFHDARGTFLVGHGQAARQSLESCVSCHVERDCVSCHSVIGGRRFNPHGPGFDPERLRKRNPEMCIACHGVAIPGVGRIGR